MRETDSKTIGEGNGGLRIVLSVAALVLAACGGGGSDPAPAPGQPPVLPTISIADAQVTEGNSGNVNLLFAVTLSATSTSAVTVSFATADMSATSADYVAGTGVLTIPAGAISGNVTVAVIGDTIVEGNETLRVTLSAPANATLGTASAIGTIVDDDVAATGFSLNDTGVTTCSNGVNNALACNNVIVGTDQYPRQDGEMGRDVTNNVATDGVAGFSFTKLAADGKPLPAQNIAYVSMPWPCVRDNVTGLTWEVRTDDNGLRDKDWTYTWYNSTGIDDGGDVGKGNAGECVDVSNCDTEKYASAVNAAMLCGRGDWRVPTRAELLSIVHFGAVAPPLVDAGYFPTSSINKTFWSSQNADGHAWGIEVAGGSFQSIAKSEPQAIRLVSGGR